MDVQSTRFKAVYAAFDRIFSHKILSILKCSKPASFSDATEFAGKSLDKILACLLSYLQKVTLYPK